MTSPSLSHLDPADDMLAKLMTVVEALKTNMTRLVARVDELSTRSLPADEQPLRLDKIGKEVHELKAAFDRTVSTSSASVPYQA